MRLVPRFTLHRSGVGRHRSPSARRVVAVHSYWDAFLLEMGLIAFFLPYTYVYNLVYDKVRERLVRRGDAARVSEA